MKTPGMKVLALGFIVLLVSTIWSFYVAWYQFDLTVIQESMSVEAVKRLSTHALFGQALTLISVVTIVAGVLILLSEPAKPEPKPSS